MGVGPSRSRAAERDWSDLPPELGALILCRLLSHADRVRFGAVCRQWRLASRRRRRSSLPPALPWLTTCRANHRSLPDGEQHRLPISRSSFFFLGFFVGCFDGWRIFHRRWPEPCIFLINPFSKASKILPDRCDDLREPQRFHPVGSNIGKIIVCSGDLVAAAIRPAGVYKVYNRIAFCRPGGSLWHMSSPPSDPYGFFMDIAFYNGKLYAVHTSEDLFVHEFIEDDDNGGSAMEELKVTRTMQRMTSSSGIVYGTVSFVMRDQYLITSGDKLLMVRRSFSRLEGSTDGSAKYAFKVFEPNLGTSRWLEVDNLGDRILFISKHCSKAFHTSDFNHNVQGNRIFFVDCDGSRRFYKKRFDITICSCGMFDLRDSTLHPINMNGTRGIDGLLGTWFFPSD